MSLSKEKRQDFVRFIFEIIKDELLNSDKVSKNSNTCHDPQEEAVNYRLAVSQSKITFGNSTVNRNQ